MGGRRKEPKYDLEERTALFDESIIDFAKQVPMNQITRSLVDPSGPALASALAGMTNDECLMTNERRMTNDQWMGEAKN